MDIYFDIKQFLHKKLSIFNSSNNKGINLDWFLIFKKKN